MTTKPFKGKAIYNPSGKAGEYSYWACNFYNGCSNGCEYCYCKKGILANTMGGDKPALKKCFKNEEHALEIFEKELKQNISELQKHGLFFSFSTDPLLTETINLTKKAVAKCVYHDVKVKILTKRADFLYDFFGEVSYAPICNATFNNIIFSVYRKEVSFGFTLTGCDELEPNASTNQERIETMKKLHDVGYKTFASIEPIVDIDLSARMIRETIGYCDLYKIGLMSGRKYAWQDLRGLMMMCYSLPSKFYFKDSFLSQAAMKREDLYTNCVTRDYNLFKQK